MAGLKELRNRIDAIKSTEKITSAMKMVAAARLRHAQDLLSKSQAYRDNIYQVAGRILFSFKKQAEENENVVILPQLCNPKPDDKSYLLLVMSADRGLCGSYNAMIARRAVARIEELKAAGKEVMVICLGQRCYNTLKRNYSDIIIEHKESAANKGVEYNEAVEQANFLQDVFTKNYIDVCEVIYSHFHSALRRDVVNKKILPIDLESLLENLPSDISGDAYYETEPSRDKVMEVLLPLIFREMIFDIMINSQASEQGARMTSMDNATRNAGDIISRLTLRYNRIRQTAITTELVEIIAGAEAI